MAQIYGRTPYSKVAPVSGELPVLVVLLEPYHGDDPRFNTYYGVNDVGDLYEFLVSVSRDDGSIDALKGEAKINAPFSTHHSPAVIRSPHPHLLTLLFATGSDGKVYQTFYDRHASASRIDHPWRDWRQLPSGIDADSAPCAVNTPDGTLALAFVTASDGQVYESVFARGPGQSWGPWKSLHFPKVSGGPAVMNSADGDRLHVFATSTAGRVVQATYVRGPGSHWRQKMLPDGIIFKGTPACFAAADGSLQVVFALSADGVVYASTRFSQPGADWSAWNQLPTNVNLSGGLSVLDSYNRKSLSVMAIDTTGQPVRCRYVRGPGSRWTDWTAVPMWTGAPGRWKGMTQLTTPATANSPESYRELFFGAHRSLRNYFWEASRGRFTIREAGVVGWIRPSAELGMPSDVDITTYDFVHDSDKYGISLEQKSAWIIRAAEVIGGFKYSDYDDDSSGEVTIDELSIVWVYSGGDGGRVRGVDPALVEVPSLTKGVSQRMGLPRFGPNLSLRAPAEELAHAICNLDDLYDSGGLLNPATEPLQLAITGSGGESPHPSPWDKMKLGWAKVKVAEKSGWYELPAVEQSNNILIVKIGTRADEYFILENRFPPGSFEDAFSGAGLAVWHIVERWPSCQKHWGRNTIRLLHCQPTNQKARGGETFLWDGANPNQSYALSDSSVPANLLWFDGTQSGLKISSISPAGPVMRFHVSVPSP